MPLPNTQESTLVTHAVYVVDNVAHPGPRRTLGGRSCCLGEYLVMLAPSGRVSGKA